MLAEEEVSVKGKIELQFPQNIKSYLHDPRVNKLNTPKPLDRHQYQRNPDIKSPSEIKLNKYNTLNRSDTFKSPTSVKSKVISKAFTMKLLSTA